MRYTAALRGKSSRDLFPCRRIARRLPGRLSSLLRNSSTLIPNIRTVCKLILNKNDHYIFEKVVSVILPTYMHTYIHLLWWLFAYTRRSTVTLHFRVARWLHCTFASLDGYTTLSRRSTVTLHFLPAVDETSLHSTLSRIPALGFVFSEEGVVWYLGTVLR